MKVPSPSTGVMPLAFICDRPDRSISIEGNFLSFNSDSKPWPFNDKYESSDSNEDGEHTEVVDVESEDLELDDEQPEQTTS